MTMRPRSVLVLSALLAAACAAGGCVDGFGTAPDGEVAVPAPVSLLLPRKMRIHPFTGTRVFGAAGGIAGIDVRIEALDAWGDSTKAFGTFRFELYRYRYDPDREDPKGERLTVWVEDVRSARANRTHWNAITRTYQFKLAWAEAIPAGRRFVLVVVYESPFSGRLFDERVFVSGQ